MEHKQTENAVITNVDESKGIVEAIWAVMGNIDQGKDIIHPGAFKKTFNERGNQIKLLDNHRSQSVLDALGTILELKELRGAELPQELMDAFPEASAGAWGKFQFQMDTPEGDGAFKRIKSGAVKGWSFGYDALSPDRTTVNKDGKQISVRNLREIKLYEISPVLFPMNEAVITTDTKSDGKATWTTAFINDLPDGSFLHIESGGEKNGGGMTTPRSLRHLPYKNNEGNVDLPHLRSAISRLGQTATGTTGGESWLTDSLRKSLQTKAQGILEKEQGGKSVDKAGRVLSTRNAKRIQSAMSLLHDALAEAGLLIEDNEGADKNTTFNLNITTSLENEEALNNLQAIVRQSIEPSNPDKSLTSEEAGPDEDKDTHLLQIIDIELEEMEVH